MTQGKLELLTPQNCALVLIDHQPQMTFGVANIDQIGRASCRERVYVLV